MVNVKRLMLVDVNCAKITADIDMMWHLPPSSGTRGVFFLRLEDRGHFKDRCYCLDIYSV